MLIYDTLSGKKKRLPRFARNDRLKMFVCGPTVYGPAHIGHARVYIVFDMIARWLRQRKVNLFYLQNITDIDDKIPDLATARHFEKEYLKDMRTLNVTAVDKYARASAHLPEIKRQIKVLLDKGYAYRTSSGIYFEVKKFPRYGQLSRQDLNKLRAGWRIEPDPEKKDPMDFALWRGSRPGWHIEDTAITEKHFGPQYDLHGAAVDLKFPHHESEIAQQEAASGKKPMVKIWMHAGFLLVNGEKMSKSLKNFITIREFLDGDCFSRLRRLRNDETSSLRASEASAAISSSNLLRLLILSHNYRSPINYTEAMAEQYQNALNNIEKFMRTINTRDCFGPKNFGPRNDGQFVKAMDDDFNTPKALAVLYDFIATAPKSDEAKKFLSEKLAILGIDVRVPKVPVAVDKLLMKREQLRDNKNFAEADKIRAEIEGKGFFVED